MHAHTQSVLHSVCVCDVVNAVYLEHLFEKVHHIGAEVRRNVVVPCLDLPEQHRHISVVKRQSATEQGVQNDSTRPNIYLWTW